MLKISFFVLLAAATTCFAGTPEAAFESLVDAIYAGDAQEFSTFLSAESAGMVSMILMMLKADPEQAAADISAELGVEVTAEEISGWSSADLLAMVLSAPGFIAEFPPRESIHVSGSTVNGDRNRAMGDSAAWAASRITPRSRTRRMRRYSTHRTSFEGKCA